MKGLTTHIIGDIESLCEEDRQLLVEFEKEIYVPSFPDDNERESIFEDILPRVFANDGIVRSYLVLSLDENGHVVAGEIFDWYPSTTDLMIIYLAVKRDERRKNVGSMMIKGGTADLIALIEQRYNKRVRMVYFETEDPSKVQPSGSFVIPLEDRIAFFKANDARVLLHDYFQPPLSEGKDWAWNLMLCVLPVFRRGEEGKMDFMPLTLPSTAETMEFLTAFYRSLDGSDLTDTGRTHLKQMERALSSAPAGPGRPM